MCSFIYAHSSYIYCQAHEIQIRTNVQRKEPVRKRARNGSARLILQDGHSELSLGFYNSRINQMENNGCEMQMLSLSIESHKYASIFVFVFGKFIGDSVMHNNEYFSISFGLSHSFRVRKFAIE